MLERTTFFIRIAESTRMCVYIFLQVRERYKKSLSQQNIPELEELLSKQEYKLQNHTVSILELNIADLKEGSAWIGQNKIAEENEGQENNESNYTNDDNDEIVGMSLRKKPIIAKDVAQDSKSNNQEIKSAKELKREMRKIALKRVKKNKAFQQKQRLEQQKNKKRSKQKLHKKTQKLTHKSGKRIKKKSAH